MQFIQVDGENEIVLFAINEEDRINAENEMEEKYGMILSAPIF